MKQDILNKEDIQTLVGLFYDNIKADTMLGPFFLQVVPVNWQKHLPMMCAFWENVLFYTGEYEGNPLATHRKIHLQHTTTVEHFKRWLQLWDETLDAHFEGPNTNKMKTHAKAIAAVMLQKL